MEQHGSAARRMSRRARKYAMCAQASGMVVMCIVSARWWAEGRASLTALAGTILPAVGAVVILPSMLGEGGCVWGGCRQ